MMHIISCKSSNGRTKFTLFRQIRWTYLSYYFQLCECAGQKEAYWMWMYNYTCTYVYVGGKLEWYISQWKHYNIIIINYSREIFENLNINFVDRIWDKPILICGGVYKIILPWTIYNVIFQRWLASTLYFNLIRTPITPKAYVILLSKTLN